MRSYNFRQVGCAKCPKREKGVFCRLSEKELSFIDRSKTANVYRRGQVVFYEGNPPLGVYCLFSGRVKLYKLSREGNGQIVGMAGPGELLGHESLLSNEPYAATTEVTDDATICFIDKNTLTKLLEQSPFLALDVARQLSRNLLRLEDKLQDLTQKSATARLALLLLELNSYSAAQLAPPIAMRFSRQTLAEAVGVTRETVIRILSQFKRRKIIASQGQRILLLQPQLLEKLAA
ncbi:MAG: Crp/Fnr family transcriptional regulator [Elusimicrobia bacterium]|nr:Crp/Fnr family transcriptional regulator [Elusimicrobiota bacterium]